MYVLIGRGVVKKIGPIEIISCESLLKYQEKIKLEMKQIQKKKSNWRNNNRNRTEATNDYSAWLIGDYHNQHWVAVAV